MKSKAAQRDLFLSEQNALCVTSQTRARDERRDELHPTEQSSRATKQEKSKKIFFFFSLCKKRSEPVTWPKPRQPVARGGTLSQVEGQSTSKCLLATCRSPTEKLSGIKPTSETKEMMGHLGANAYEVEHNTHWSSHSDDRSRQTSLLGRDLFGLRQRGVVLSTDTICMVEPKEKLQCNVVRPAMFEKSNVLFFREVI
jgi:hypothetical protein